MNIRDSGSLKIILSFHSLVFEYVYFFVHPTFLITKFMYIKIIKIDHSLQAVLDSLVTGAEALMEAKNDKFAFSDFFSGWSSNIDGYFCKLKNIN